MGFYLELFNDDIGTYFIDTNISLYYVRELLLTNNLTRNHSIQPLKALSLQLSWSSWSSCLAAPDH